MNDKILIYVYVPLIGQNYNIFIPINKKIGTIKKYIDSGYPLIIFGRTKKNAGATHYAVVYGYTNGATSAKYCKLYDPASKKRTTVSHFLKTYKHNGKLYILKD